jgi:hypothetical protein
MRYHGKAAQHLCYQAHNLNNYIWALMSVPPQAIAPNPHTNLLNVYIQIANKMGFQQKNFLLSHPCPIPPASFI